MKRKTQLVTCVQQSEFRNNPAMSDELPRTGPKGGSWSHAFKLLHDELLASNLS